ncbi:hypothetical protein U1Q18_005493, partial [Sarracenia purpurea var. burkii]
RKNPVKKAPANKRVRVSVWPELQAFGTVNKKEQVEEKRLWIWKDRSCKHLIWVFGERISASISGWRRTIAAVQVFDFDRKLQRRFLALGAQIRCGARA